MEVIAHARTSSNDRRSHRYDTGISSEYVIDFYCPFGPPPLILSLACDTILIISQEALFCYPHRFHLLHSPQHSWGIRLFIDTRDGRKSTVVIPQFPVSTWFDMFADNTYADACLTRITDKHHTYRLEMNGINMREIE